MAVETQTLNVQGMSCMHCVNSVKNTVGALSGINKVDVDLAGKKVIVVYDSDKANLAEIKEAIEDAGYQVV